MYRNKMFGLKASAMSSLKMWFGMLIFYLHDQNLFVYRLLSELKLEVKTTQNLKFVFSPPLELMSPGELAALTMTLFIFWQPKADTEQNSAPVSTWESIFHKCL